jgi:5-methylcytosine-specific restriction endonuclease McrBC regulatory subunit McrC
MRNKVRTASVVRYGSSSSVRLSPADEEALRFMLSDKERWTRRTPKGDVVYEPLVAELYRIDPHRCFIKPGPYVGNISLPETDLEFHPPAWLKGLDNTNILYMLMKSNPLLAQTTYLPEIKSIQQVSFQGITEPIYYVYVKETAEALKKGHYRSYVQRQTNSKNLKGKIDLVRQFKLDVKGSPMFATIQNVFSDNNVINNMLFHAAKMVAVSSSNSETVAIANRISNSLPRPNSALPTNLQKYFPEHRGAHLRRSVELAKLILSNSMLSYYGLNKQLFCLVINLFDLFEKYVTSALIRRNPSFKHQYGLPLGDPDGPGPAHWLKRRIYPDIVYCSARTLVIDVKLKPLRRYGPDIDDIYQVCFYATQMGTKKALIIYPTSTEADANIFPVDFNKANQIDLHTYKLPIATRVEMMEKNLDDLYDYIMTHIL